MTILGDKLTKHRERLGLSTQDLAVSAGLLNSRVRALEAGIEDGYGVPIATLPTLSALARALGISPLLLAAAAFEDLECASAPAGDV